ncbi:MAG: hypothetical protein IT373_01590 [Polyangiaceae bacterium]|nr:hypothetical protein [Polyangiaceae bacterium]
MCKHVAAVLYGVGHRLDSRPELFFDLRGVEVSDLAARGATLAVDVAAPDALGGADLGAMFGIELEAAPVAKRSPKKAATEGAKAKSAKTKAVKQQAVKKHGALPAAAPAGRPTRANALTRKR